MAFDLAECDSVSKLKDKEISGYKTALVKDSAAMVIQQKEIELRDNRLKEKDSDIVFYQKESKSKDKKIGLLKLGGLSLIAAWVSREVYGLVRHLQE